MTPKEKAKELVTMHHNLIQDIGGELGQEILVTILAKQCALIAVDQILKANVVWYDGSIPNKYWQNVKKEIENL